jgi:dienelactone hydrolase
LRDSDSCSRPLGVALLHGKHGSPEKHISGLAETLAQAGMLVAVPELPWSRRRAYDAGYLDGLRELELAVADLRARGAAVVAAGGQSLGANAALAYAARFPGLDGLFALAPAHTPESGAMRAAAAAGVALAREMIVAGRGAETASFPEMIMGRERQVLTSAQAYLSYYDPEGPAVMPLNAARLAPPLPVLWVLGSRDPLAATGPAEVFDLLPPHPLSRRTVVDADHLGVPAAAAGLVLDWLRGLGPAR